VVRICGKIVLNVPSPVYAKCNDVLSQICSRNFNSKSSSYVEQLESSSDSASSAVLWHCRIAFVWFRYEMAKAVYCDKQNRF